MGDSIDNVDPRRRQFDREIIDALSSSNYTVIAQPIIGGQRLDAIVVFDDANKQLRLAVETRFLLRSRVLASLSGTLYRLAYLRNLSLIDYGIIVPNYEVLARDRALSNDLGIPILSLPELQDYLSVPQRFNNFLAKFGQAQSASVHEYDLAARTKRPAIESSLDRPSGKRIFVAIEFNDHNEDVFNHGISAVAARLDMEAVRVSDVEHNSLIISEIRRQIVLADAVVADLSDDNQNVYYEAGFAHALEKQVIIIAKQGSHLRFDLSSTNCIFFRNITDLAARLETRLRAMFP